VRVEIDREGNIAIVAAGQDDDPGEAPATASVLSERIAAMKGTAK
jgi:hypothetical protein